MINKRLLNISPESKKPIMFSVLFQMIGLISTIIIAVLFGMIIDIVFITNDFSNITLISLAMCLCILIRFISTILSGKYSNLAGHWIKKVLRKTIYNNILNKGLRYNESISTSEVLQIAVEGVEQLEAYFENYLPQFFYAMTAPFLLFIVVSFINIKIALTLLLCVPLIPIAIVFVQKLAKKLLAKYWGEYLTLGDHFLENLQGLTTLKIYQSDEFKHQEMDKQAERFRKITMRVLTMQLNSISVMDIMAYGSSALGMVVTMFVLKDGAISLSSAFVIILLCNEFFLPMRLLGSFFHVAMNGLSASKKMFKLFDSKQRENGDLVINDNSIIINNLSFSYDDNFSLKNLSLQTNGNEFISIVGNSGSGKSTISKLLMSQFDNYTGSILIGGSEVRDINMSDLYKKCTFININSYLFEGTIKENLLLANQNASDDMLVDVLKRVHLYDFINTQNGLDTMILARGSNLSGGQCQRLALARALLHDSLIYVFDEATSNIDSESENCILEVLKELKKTKTVIFITHRLLNVIDSDLILVMENGCIKETGKHLELLKENGLYSSLFNVQNDLLKEVL